MATDNQLNALLQSLANPQSDPMEALFAQALPNPVPQGQAQLQGTGNVTPEERVFIDQGYQQIQDTIQNLLATSPTFRKQANMPNEDDLSENAPMTGQANTLGGVARVNRHTATHGVTASRDAKTSQVTLTNIGSDGRPTPQSQRQVYGFNPLDATTSSSVNDLLGQLKKTSNADEARGIAATLRTSLATESARLEAAADTFAENKLGIPRMKQMLQAAEVLDSQRPGYMPGIGDSENTQAIRKQLYAAQTAARGEAQNWLKSNLSAAQLRAAAENASAEITRIEKLSAVEANRAATSAQRREDRAFLAEQKAAEQYDSLAPSQKLIMARMNPELAAKPNNHQEMVNYFERQLKTDPDFKTVIVADPADLPMLAISGNKLARQLVVQEESSLTGRPADEIDREIKEAQTFGKKPEAVDAWIENAISAVKTNKVQARKDKRAEYELFSMDKTAAGKAKFAEIQADIAMEGYRRARTNRFLSNVPSWGLGDPDLDAAIKVSVGTTGKADIAGVTAAFVGNKTGPEALAAYALMKEKINRAAAKQSQSVFGGVNSLAAIAMVDQQALATQGAGLADWWAKKWTDPQFQTVMNATGVVSPFARIIQNQINNQR